MVGDQRPLPRRRAARSGAPSGCSTRPSPAPTRSAPSGPGPTCSRRSGRPRSTRAGRPTTRPTRRRCIDFTTAVADDATFLADLDATIAPFVARPGGSTSIAQATLRLLSPGVPDTYQGTELWDLSLVDPTTVARSTSTSASGTLREIRRLSAADAWSSPVHRAAGTPKLLAVHRACSCGAIAPELFELGDYAALEVDGLGAEHAVGFVRADEVAVVVPRLPIGSAPAPAEVRVALPVRPLARRASPVPSVRSSGTVSLAELTPAFPVAVLTRIGAFMSATSRPHVWAPNAEAVELVLAERREPMTPVGRGWYESPASLPAGTGYQFALDGGDPVPDPRSPAQPDGVAGPSHTVDHDAFAWTDALWRGLPPPAAVIYELHVGTFSAAGTFDGVIEHLDDLVDLGVDVIEVMPVATFAGERGWGYDGVALFAPHPAYGGPDGLKRLVDAAHGRASASCSTWSTTTSVRSGTTCRSSGPTSPTSTTRRGARASTSTRPAAPRSASSSSPTPASGSPTTTSTASGSTPSTPWPTSRPSTSWSR